MIQLDEIAQDYARHATEDYVGLWQIASRVREDLNLSDNFKTKEKALLVVSRLFAYGLRPGNYNKAGFRFWDEGEADTIIARVDREWDPAQGDPTLAHPICWFAIK